MVLKNEVASVGPVIGDLARIVVAHHVGGRAIPCARQPRAWTLAGFLARIILLSDEAIHPSAVDRGASRQGGVGTAFSEIARVVERRGATPGRRVWHADCR